MTFDHAYAALLFASLGVLTWMYHTLYNSDPGSPDAISKSAGQSSPCEHCGMTSPTIRVRHDFATGADCPMCRRDYWSLTEAMLCVWNIVYCNAVRIIAGQCLGKHLNFMLLCAGKCVVAFDHYCMLINTTVGDSNHALFLAYCTLQLFLILWGWSLAWHAVGPCYSLFNITRAVSRKTCFAHKLYQLQGRCLSHLHVLCIMLHSVCHVT